MNVPAEGLRLATEPYAPHTNTQKTEPSLTKCSRYTERLPVAVGLFCFSLLQRFNQVRRTDTVLLLSCQSVCVRPLKMKQGDCFREWRMNQPSLPLMLLVNVKNRHSGHVPALIWDSVSFLNCYMRWILICVYKLRHCTAPVKDSQTHRSNGLASHFVHPWVTCNWFNWQLQPYATINDNHLRERCFLEKLVKYQVVFFASKG